MEQSLRALLAQAQAAAKEILEQFEQRVQATAGQPAVMEDPTAHRWTLELTATQARVQLRDIHRRSAEAISTMQLRDAISEGEAMSVQQALERLLGTALNKIEQQVGRTTHGP